jgi:non-heme chloroperoxidase
MPTITTTDGIEIFCKDWGSGQPIVFSHGWPLLEDAIHVGHSTGAGEVVRSIARHAESRVARAVPISAVPPLMVQARVAA